jgi:tripartite-type tricarboxylate transporter receptor subunit TctC
VALGVNTASSVLPQIRGGKLKALAVFGSGSNRFSLLPSVPTLGETVPGYVSPSSWTGYFAPALLPEAILRRLNKEFITALASPDIAKLYEGAGLIVAPSTPEQFASTLASDTAKWKKLVSDLKLVAD